MVTGTNYFGDGKLRRRNVAAERILGMKTSMESKQDAKNKSKEGIERVRETASTSENEICKQKDPNFKNDLRKMTTSISTGVVVVLFKISDDKW